MLNEVKGNMYDWVTHTWNTVKGECPHGCHYCYMKRFGEQPPVRFDETELKTKMGTGNHIFVGSSCDMFADAIPDEWISRTFEHCRRYDGAACMFPGDRNTYLFQSKNPASFIHFRSELPSDPTLATTIETNRFYPEMGATPSPGDRAQCMGELSDLRYQTTVTIEPILDFDLNGLIDLILIAKPKWINIGANSNSFVPLPEPDSRKIANLILELSKITKIRRKENLKRLL